MHLSDCFLSFPYRSTRTLAKIVPPPWVTATRCSTAKPYSTKHSASPRLPLFPTSLPRTPLLEVSPLLLPLAT